MSLNTPGTSHEFSKPIQETLTKAQKNVIDRVVLILESDPELNKKVSEKFQKNLLDIASNEEKFNLLMEKIGATEMQKLGEIEKSFNNKEISEDLAKSESKKIIEHFTQMKLSALKVNVSANQA
jgi:hypothetical protein